MSAMYKESGYWDTRYERERALPEAGGHEWFGPYEDFAHLVRRQLRSGLRVLVLGIHVLYYWGGLKSIHNTNFGVP